MIGEKLLELRKKKGLSQEEVAQELNVSRQTISKWETDQSTPDFDKIIPICELYNITTDELLRGIKKEDDVVIDTMVNEVERIDKKDKKAKGIAISVVLYITSIAAIVGFSVAGAPVLGLVFFFIINAIATGIIVYSAIVYKRELTEEEKRAKGIGNIVSIGIVILYFIISFITNAWHVTWILFIVGGLLEEIIKLIYSLKGDESNDKRN